MDIGVEMMETIIIITTFGDMSVVFSGYSGFLYQ
jgi:hypothetical protein